MPILDVEIVADEPPAAGLAQRLADAAAEVLAAPPSTLWVKLRHLDPAMYAENAAHAPHPVFRKRAQARNSHERCSGRACTPRRSTCTDYWSARGAIAHNV